MSFKHIPVLFQETLDSLNLQDGGIYVDGTLGGGGHSEAILKATAPTGTLIGIDQDEQALASTGERLSIYGERFITVQGNFAQIDEIVPECGYEEVDGVLMDIGVSSHQLDTAERGFSYMADGPLDMRMNMSGDLTAQDIVMNMEEEDLANLIYKYGEERFSRRIAHRIVEKRGEGVIETTTQLAEIIRGAIPKEKRKKEDQHPAKRTFQALRIAVNDELGVLEAGMEAGFKRLKSGGRMSIITFHSLEDRIVKEQFKAWATGCTCPPKFPVCVCGKEPVGKLLNRKPVVASKEELEENPRARSAKLRTIIKL